MNERIFDHNFFKVLGAAVFGGGATLAEIDQVIRILIGAATLFYICLKIWRKLRHAFRDKNPKS